MRRTMDFEFAMRFFFCFLLSSPIAIVQWFRQRRLFWQSIIFVNFIKLVYDTKRHTPVTANKALSEFHFINRLIWWFDLATILSAFLSDYSLWWSWKDEEWDVMNQSRNQLKMRSSITDDFNLFALLNWHASASQ